MSDNLELLASAMLSAARRAGADAADALAVSGRSVSVDVLDRALEHAERSEGVDIGLRVLVGARQACVSSSDIRAGTITEMAARAVAMAREAPEDDAIGLAEPAQFSARHNGEGLELYDPSSGPTPDDLQAAALAAEAAALAVKGVSKVSGSSAGYFSKRLYLATSNGFVGGYGRTGRSISCVAITGEGSTMERDYAAEERTFQADLPTAAEVGRQAGLRTISRLGARKPPTGAFPVLFDERISSSLIGHLLAAINGNAIVRGASWLRDALGAQVLPRGISLTEDPYRPRITGSRPFDGEGLAPVRRDVIADGVLSGWTLDLATARRLKMKSTGNAARGPSAPPSPSAGNMALTPGADSRDDLIAMMGTGLIITSMIGAAINPTTGDYSRGASGFWVENGEITGPVNECTVAGNLRDMLLTIRPANDARAHRSRLVPSLLVEGLTIAGA